MRKRIKLKIRRNPTRSPLNLIRKKLNRSNLLPEEKVETDNENEAFIDVDRPMDILQKVQRIIDDDETQFQLLKMIYLDDIDTNYVVNNLGISKTELVSIVDNLVEQGYLKFNSDNDAEITQDGIEFIKSRDLKFEY